MTARLLSRPAARTLLLALALLTGATSARAETIVPGLDLRGPLTWHASDSQPIHVTGWCSVSMGGALTIEPGVTVVFDAGTGIRIGGDYNGYGGPFPGSLTAEGTVEQPIVFQRSATATGEWIAFDFTTGSAIGAPSHLSHCTIDGLRVTCRGTSQPLMDNCVVQNSPGVAFRLEGSSPSFNRVTFQGNASYDVERVNGATGGFSDCTFNTGSHTGIFDVGGTGQSTLDHCQFHSNGTADFALEVQPGTIDSAAISIDGYAKGVRLLGAEIPRGAGVYRSFPPLGGSQYYQLSGGISVVNSAMLRLQPGVVMKGESGSSISVGFDHNSYNGPITGHFMAVGTDAQRVVLTSMSPAPGNWRGLYLSEGAGNPDARVEMKYCSIDGAGNGNGGMNAAILCVGSSHPALEDCTIQNSSGVGIHLTGGSPSLNRVLFQGNADHDVQHAGDSYGSFSNCTFHTGSHTGFVSTPGSRPATIDHCAFDTDAGADYALEVFPGEIDSASFSISGYSRGVRILGGEIQRGALVYHSYPPLGGLQYYHLAGSIQVWYSAMLRLQPGVIMKADPGTRIFVGGDHNSYNGPIPGFFWAIGTASRPIMMGSLNPAPNNWRGLYFSEGSSGPVASSRLDFCTVDGGGNGVSHANVECNGTNQPWITNSEVRNSSGWGILGSSAPAVTVENSSITGNASGGASSTGGTVLSMMHNWWGDPSGPNDPSPAGGSNAGLGQYVTDNVNYSNWLPTPFCFGSTNVVTASVAAGGGGSISPSGSVTACPGSDLTFTFTAEPCRTLSSFTIDGVPVTPTPTGSYTLLGVTAAHAVEATFTASSFAITASAGANGCITPAGTQVVPCGGGASYTVYPDAHWTVDELKVNGVPVAFTQALNPTFTLTNVQGPQVVEATFMPWSSLQIASVEDVPQDNGGHLLLTWGGFANYIFGLRVTDPGSSAPRDIASGFTFTMTDPDNGFGLWSVDVATTRDWVAGDPLGCGTPAWTTFQLYTYFSLQYLIGRSDIVGGYSSDNLMGFPLISISDLSVPEGNSGHTAGAVMVGLGKVASAPVSVDWHTVDLTASSSPAEGDYVAASGTLVIPAGQQQGTIPLEIVGDTKRESSESFKVVLSNAVGGVLAAKSEAIITITNDDPLPSLSVTDVSLPEGDTPSTPFTFTVTESNPNDQAMTVHWVTSAGTATPADNDYGEAYGDVTFPANDPGPQTFTVAVTGDTKHEADEQFTVTLSAPANAQLGAKNSGTGTITNDDAVPIVTIFDALPVHEGATGSTAATFDVLLSGVTNQDVVIPYATADVSARVSDGDYEALAGTLTIPAGSLAAQAHVMILGDLRCEGDETFSLVLSAPLNGGATLGTTTGRASILDDDPAPVPSRLMAWWTFDDLRGAGVLDLAHYASGQDLGVFAGGASAGATGVVGQALACGTSASGVVATPPLKSNSLYCGAEGIVIDAWIYLNPGSGPSGTRVIASARTSTFGSADLVFGVANHLLGVALPSQGSFQSTAVLTESAWHHVAVVIAPQQLVGEFFVDDLRTETFVLPNFTIGRFADFTVGYTPGSTGGFNGRIDEVVVFRPYSTMPANNAALALIRNAGARGMRREFVRLPLWVSLNNYGAASVCAQFTNLTGGTPSPQTNHWDLIAGCKPITSTLSFTAPSQDVAVPTNGTPVSAPMTVNVTNPRGTACSIALTATNATTGNVYSSTVVASKVSSISATGSAACGQVASLAWSRVGPTSAMSSAGSSSFVLHNEGDTPASLTCHIDAVDGETGEPSDGLRLNGSPPGTPVDVPVVVGALDSALVSVEVSLDDNSPFLTDQIRLSADVDGDEVLDPLAVSMVEAAEDTVGPTTDVGPTPPATSTSLTASPNPFRGLTTFHFSLADARRVDVAVYDVVGRRVRTLQSGFMEAGEKGFVWDGRDAGGRSTGAGIYFVRIDSAGLRLGTKVILVP